MAKVYDPKGLLGIFAAFRGEIEAVERYLQTIGTYAKNARRADVAESDIATNITAMYAVAEDLCDALRAKIAAVVWTHAVAVEIGRPAMFSKGKWSGQRSGVSSASYSIFAPQGASVFTALVDGDTVDIKLDGQNYSGVANVGPDVMLNGNFAAAGTSWTAGAGWTFAGGKAVGGPGTGDLSQVPADNMALEMIQYGNRFEVTFTISGYASGSVTPMIGTNAGTTRSADGTFVETITFTNDTGDGASFILDASSLQGDIDNVLVVALDWFTLAPAIGADGAISDLPSDFVVVLKER